MRKRLAVLGASVLMALAMMGIAYGAEWKEDAAGWWYQNDDGSYPVNEWKWIDGNGDGTAESYCFDDRGYLYVNTVTPDGYQVNESGAWVQDGAVQTKTVSMTQSVPPTAENAEAYAGTWEVYEYGNHLGSYGMPRLHRLEISRRSDGNLQVLGYIFGAKSQTWVRSEMYDHTLYPIGDGIYKSLPEEDYFGSADGTTFIAEGDQLMTLADQNTGVTIYQLYKKVQ